jgi:hypothetical protein
VRSTVWEECRVTGCFVIACMLFPVVVRSRKWKVGKEEKENGERLSKGSVGFIPTRCGDKRYE